jgi:hypothetical protein
MSRYLLSLIGFVALLAFLGGGGLGRLTSGVRASREVISANPASAENLTPLESAGQNVTRQSSSDGVGGTATGNTTDPFIQPDDIGRPVESTPTPTPSPVVTPPVQPAQDPIPALW